MGETKLERRLPGGEDAFLTAGGRFRAVVAGQEITAGTWATLLKKAGKVAGLDKVRIPVTVIDFDEYAPSEEDVDFHVGLFFAGVSGLNGAPQFEDKGGENPRLWGGLYAINADDARLEHELRALAADVNEAREKYGAAIDAMKRGLESAVRIDRGSGRKGKLLAQQRTSEILEGLKKRRPGRAGGGAARGMG